MIDHIIKKHHNTSSALVSDLTIAPTKLDGHNASVTSTLLIHPAY